MKCKFIKKNSKECEAKAIKDEKYCFYHSPKQKKKRKLASANGGLRSKKNNLDLPPVKIQNPKDIVIVLAETLNLLRSGKIYPNHANSVFIGCNIFMKAHKESEEYVERKKLRDLLSI